MKQLTLLFILLFSVVCTAQNKLQYNFKVGDSFTVEQEAKQQIIQDINGVNQEVENHLIGKMHFKVTNITKEDITMRMEFRRLKMFMSSPSLGELSNVDSASNDTTDITSKMFKGLLNLPVTLIMSKNGKIKSVTGGDRLIKSMFTAVNITDPEIIDASTDQLDKQFGSEALSNSFEQMTHFYPIDAVSIGDNWTNSYSGGLSAKNNWKLKEYNANTTTITGTAVTSMTNIDENVVMTLTGTQTTTIVASTKTGLFSIITVTGENKGDTVIQAQNMTIPTSIKSIITYKISQ